MRTLLAFALVLVAAACSHNVYSPPARTMPLDTPATLAEGKVGVELDGAGGGVGFSRTIYSGTAKVTTGLDDRLEGSAEVSYAKVDFDSPAGTDTNGWAARAGVKYAINPKYLAITGGAGFGHWAGGPFVSADGGVIGGYENCYVVPFAAVRLALSAPISAKPVDTAETADQVGQFVAAPTTTFHVGVQLGVKVPLFAPRCGAPAPFEIFAAGQAIHLVNTKGQDDGGSELGGGFRFVF